jgi:phosphatidylglycerophosphatase A
MKLIWAMLLGFGLGRSPVAPGTLGSLLPVAVALALVGFGLTGWMLNAILVLIAVNFSIACVRFGHLAEAQLGVKDPSAVVADEIAGQALALLFLPWRTPGEAGALAWNAALALIAFATFRIFDILKPPPADQVQSLPGGWGILMDDIVAAAFAVILTQLAARWLLPMIL